MNQDLSLVEFALSNNAFPNVTDIWGFTPLMFACKSINAKIEIVELLLKHPQIKIDQVDNSYNSSFSFACKQENYEIAALLLKHLADPNLINEDKMKGIDLCANKVWQLELQELADSFISIREKKLPPIKPKWLTNLK